MYQNILKFASDGDVLKRYLQVFKNTMLFFYLLYDAGVWLGKAQIVPEFPTAKLQLRAVRFWFASLLFSIAIDLYSLFLTFNRLQEVQAKERHLRRQEKSQACEDAQNHAHSPICRQNQAGIGGLASVEKGEGALREGCCKIQAVG